MTVAIHEVACARCGRSTTMPHLLAKHSRSFRLDNSPQLLCPRCVARGQTIYRIVIYAIYGLLGVGFACTPLFDNRNIRDDPLVVFRFITACVLFEPIMMVIHETAHALIGRMAGLCVFGAQLGSGPLACKFWIRDFFVAVHLVPAGGYCVAGLKPERADKWRLILMIAAGPLVHAVSIAVLLICFWSKIPLSFPGFLIGGWVCALLAINVVMLVVNLIPHDVRRDGEKFPNDGKRLLGLVKRDARIDAWIQSRYTIEILCCLEKGRIPQAREWLNSGRGLLEKSLPGRIVELNVLGAESNWSEARHSAIEWQSQFSTPLQKAVLSTWAAVATVYVGGSLDEADALCNQSMSMMPWDPAVETVRAFVSLAQGRDAEAESFLKKAGTPPNWAAQAVAAHIWAELYRHKGNVRLQRKWERRAFSLDPAGAFRVPRAAHGATVC